MTTVNYYSIRSNRLTTAFFFLYFFFLSGKYLVTFPDPEENIFQIKFGELKILKLSGLNSIGNRETLELDGKRCQIIVKLV